MALASRTDQPDWARELIALLDIDHRFAYHEIYPSSKLRHFAALQSDSGAEFEQMLFFDDELWNIHEVSTLGVTCIHVPDGFGMELFERGVQAWREG